MPGWKHPVGRRLDKLIEQAVPGVRQAVKWTSPFYGADAGEGCFLNFHSFTQYVQVDFLSGGSLRLRPPRHSTPQHTMYLELTEAQTSAGEDKRGVVHVAIG